jgi:hypothetical protein
MSTPSAMITVMLLLVSMYWIGVLIDVTVALWKGRRS